MAIKMLGGARVCEVVSCVRSCIASSYIDILSSSVGNMKSLGRCAFVSIFLVFTALACLSCPAPFALPDGDSPCNKGHGRFA
jgi:hypothetical protein